MSHAGRYKRIPEDGTTIFAVGVAPWETACGRLTPSGRVCGGRLFHEPAMARCLACGALWPVRGGVLRDQYHFELASGLSGGNGPVQPRRNLEESRHSEFQRKRPLRVDPRAPTAQTIYWTRGLRPENA